MAPGPAPAVPIFIDFMQQATKGHPVGDFRPPPKDAKFILVNGSREAFRNGTEPRSTIAAPGAVAGPRPYSTAFPGGEIPGAPGVQPAALPPPKPPSDVSGLY